jgi:hypothetical protein
VVSSPDHPHRPEKTPLSGPRGHEVTAVVTNKVPPCIIEHHGRPRRMTTPSHLAASRLYGLTQQPLCLRTKVVVDLPQSGAAS